MFSSNASQVSNDVKYIEDVCSVYLRTGTGSSQTVTTGIKENTGALVISKSRSAATDWAWYDTFRGATYDLVSNSTAAQTTQSQGLTSFNADGHTWGTLAKVNTSGATYVDTVLKPTPKFFDVVTWSGDGTDDRSISHNLGSVPGCIIVKRSTSSFGTDWAVYHRSLGVSQTTYLNKTNAATGSNPCFGSSSPTSTTFTVTTSGGNNDSTNWTGGTYVAYLFAHDAGGFGLTGTDNVISCGSFTGNTTVNLGYEPQWVLVKNYAGADSWTIMDNMRGMPVTGFSQALLRPNTSGAEGSGAGVFPMATGFTTTAYAGLDCIYIAIRRGPMKVPTDATKVFTPVLTSSATNPLTVTTGFPVDLLLGRQSDGAYSTYDADRLRGSSTSSVKYLTTNSTTAETTGSGFGFGFDSNTSIIDNGFIAGYSFNKIYWNFRRAPSFFDVVCYTGTGATIALNHNLAAVPELMIVKSRGAATGSWVTYTSTYGSGSFIRLNSTSGNNTGAGNLWGATTPTSSLFYVGEGGAGGLSVSANNYVAYLFATCAGISKVGSYTGTGTTLQVNCGFTAGSRFVLIKRTDSAGDWYVWDTARGIVSGNDPYLLLNSTAAEVTSTDYIDTYSAGFEISSTAPAAINASGGTFIFLAIA